MTSLRTKPDTGTAQTPGPWEYNDPAKFKQGFGKFSETAVYAPGNCFPWRMAEVSGPSEEVEIANARLIAAAPVLLAALKATLGKWVDLVESGDAGFWDAEEEPHVIAARAAIAAAEGRQP